MKNEEKWFKIAKSLPNELLNVYESIAENRMDLTEKGAGKKMLSKAKKFACCFSENKNLECRRKDEKERKKWTRETCISDLMYDIKLNKDK